MDTTEGFVLDLVIEGVAPPSADDCEGVFPRPLREAWFAAELAVPADAKEPRRAWRARDPESDLELTVVWTRSPEEPEDPAEPAAEAGAEGDAAEAPQAEETGEAPGPPSFDLGLPGNWEIPSWDPESAEPPPSADTRRSKLPRGDLLFGHKPRAHARREDLVRVFELGLRLAERLGKRLLDPVLGETFEPEDWAYRITEPFRARAFVATHWVRTDESATGDDWIHTYGMERFGLPDLEVFFCPGEREDGNKVVEYVLELIDAWVRDEAPEPSARPRKLEGVKVRVVEPKVVREKQKTWSEEDLADHDGPRVAIVPVAPDWTRALDEWRPTNVTLRPPGLVERLCALTGQILPAVRARFAGGAQVKLKARFPILPGGAAARRRRSRRRDESHDGHERERDLSPEEDGLFESMWINVETWDDQRIRGRLANPPERRDDLSQGSAVEVTPEAVWDIQVLHDGRVYRGVSLRQWLRDGP